MHINLSRPLAFAAFLVSALNTFAGDLQSLAVSPHTITLANGKTFTLNLPEGFDISIAAQGLKRVRFMAKSPDGRIFVTDMYNRADNKRGTVYILDGFDPQT